MKLIDFDEYRASKSVECIEYILTFARVNRFQNQVNQTSFTIRGGHIMVGDMYFSVGDQGLGFSNEQFTWKFVPVHSHPRAFFIEFEGQRLQNDNGNLILIQPDGVLNGTAWFIDDRDDLDDFE